MINDTMQEQRTYTIITSDEVHYQVPEVIVKASSTLNDVFSECPDDNIVPISVSSKVMNLLNEFYELRKTLTEEDDHENKLHTVKEEGEFFEKLDKETVREFGNSVDFLGIEYLQILCAKKIARILEEMTTEQIREYTGVEDDYENEEVRQKNAKLCAWMYDDY